MQDLIYAREKLIYIITANKLIFLKRDEEVQDLVKAREKLIFIITAVCLLFL